MSKIVLLDKILNSLRDWIKEHHKVASQIENNILQRDCSSKYEEKILSIGLSSFLIYTGSGIIGIFGIHTGGFIPGVILFFVGLGLSKIINRKIFGVERGIENIKESERNLLNFLKNVDEGYKTMGLQIRFKKMPVCFTAYPTHKKQLQILKEDLLSFDTSSLALKYRYQHKYIAKKYINLANRFDAIYTHKQGERYA